MEVEGVRITWDDYVEQAARMYGTVVVDHFKSLFGERFYVGVQGAGC